MSVKEECTKRYGDNFKLTVEDYKTEGKAIVIRGPESRKYSQNILDMGGKFNSLLVGGAGYIFPKTRLSKVFEFFDKIKEGKIDTTEKKEYPKFQKAEQHPFTEKDFLSLVDRVEKLEILVSKLSSKKCVSEQSDKIKKNENVVVQVVQEEPENDTEDQIESTSFFKTKKLK